MTEPRVVTLIASATEIVASLGLSDHLVGISHECDYPPELLNRPRLSAPKVDPSKGSAEIDRDVRSILTDGLSVYRVDVDALESVRPDVVITQDHCEVCAVSLTDVEEALCSLDLPGASVVSLHPSTWADVLSDVERVASALGVPAEGARVVQDMTERLEALRERTREVDPKRVALIEWLAPPMVAGGWMPELARAVGAEPVIVTDPHRFATVDWPDIVAADPDMVVVLPCGFDLERSLDEAAVPGVAAGLRSIPAVQRGGCRVVDGNAYFNRPGPRLIDSAELLAGLVHPELFPEHAESFGNVVATWT